MHLHGQGSTGERAKRLPLSHYPRNRQEAPHSPGALQAAVVRQVPGGAFVSGEPGLDAIHTVLHLGIRFGVVPAAMEGRGLGRFSISKSQ